MYALIFCFSLLFGVISVYSQDDYLHSNEFKSKPYFKKIKQIEDTFELSENSQLLLKSAEEYLALIEKIMIKVNYLLLIID